MKLGSILNPPRSRRAAMLLAIAALLMLSMLGRKDIVTSHEGRVVQTARLMTASGWPWNAATVEVPVVSLQQTPDGPRLRPSSTEPPIRVNPWLVPVLNRAVRLQKPPLPYWCAAVLFKIFGFGEGWARLVPALFGAISTLMVYDIGRRTLGSRGGWYAGLAWISTHFVFDEFRKAMADPYLAFFTLACVWAWIAACGARSTRGRTILTLSAYASLGFLMLAKGILIHPVLAIAAFDFCHRRRPLNRWPLHVTGVLLAIAIALPWFAYAYMHVPHALQIWRFESIGEVMDNDDNARPFWFYFPNLVLISLPWTPILVVAIAHAFSQLRKQTHEETGASLPARTHHFFPFIWYAATILIFSFVKLKKNAYLLPMMPAQSLLIAQGLLLISAAWQKRASRAFAEAMANVQTFLGIGAAIALPILAWSVFPNRLAGAAMCGAGLLVAWTPLLYRRGSLKWVSSQAIMYALIVAIFVALYSSAKENQRSGKPAGLRLASLLEDGHAATLPGRIAPDVAAYVPLELLAPSNASRLYVVVDDPRDKAKADPKAFAQWVTYGRVTSVTLLPPAENAKKGSKRWKTFEITVEPDGR